MRRDHPLATRACTLSDCLEYDWVMQPSGSLMRGTVERFLQERHLALPGTVIETGSLMLTLAFVIRSQAVGTMSTPAASLFAEDQASPLVRLRVAGDLAVAPYSVVTLRDRTLTPAAQTFLTVLQTQLRQRAGSAPVGP